MIYSLDNRFSNFTEATLFSVYSGNRTTLRNCIPHKPRNITSISFLEMIRTAGKKIENESVVGLLRLGQSCEMNRKPKPVVIKVTQLLKLAGGYNR